MMSNEKRVLFSNLNSVLRMRRSATRYLRMRSGVRQHFRVRRSATRYLRMRSSVGQHFHMRSNEIRLRSDETIVTHAQWSEMIFMHAQLSKYF